MTLQIEFKTGSIELQGLTKSCIKVNFIDIDNANHCQPWIANLNWNRKSGKPINFDVQFYQNDNGKLMSGFDIKNTKFKETGRKANFNTCILREHVEPLINEIKQQVDTGYYN